MKFITKDSSQSTLHIGHTEMYREEKINTKFLDLQTLLYFTLLYLTFHLISIHPFTCVT